MSNLLSRLESNGSQYLNDMCILEKVYQILISLSLYSENNYLCEASEMLLLHVQSYLKVLGL